MVGHTTTCARADGACRHLAARSVVVCRVERSAFAGPDCGAGAPAGTYDTSPHNWVLHGNRGYSIGTTRSFRISSLVTEYEPSIIRGERGSGRLGGKGVNRRQEDFLDPQDARDSERKACRVTYDCFKDKARDCPSCRNEIDRYMDRLRRTSCAGF